MLFGFFTQTGKTLNLPKNKYLKGIPQLCCQSSNKYPYQIQETSKIFPQMKISSEAKRIPLFVAFANNTIVEHPTSGKFHFIFYPDPDKPPSLNHGSENSLLKEYWNNLQAMIICQDINGYYLGGLDDPQAILFEICSQEQSQAWICPVQSQIDTSICYGSHLQFLSDRIYLRKA